MKFGNRTPDGHHDFDLLDGRIEQAPRLRPRVVILPYVTGRLSASRTDSCTTAGSRVAPGSRPNGGPDRCPASRVTIHGEAWPLSDG